jgi:hypothetical protein
MTTTEAFLSPAPAPDIERLDILWIMEMIPHGYPVLMIDRVENLHLGERAVGGTNISINEVFCRPFPRQAGGPRVPAGAAGRPPAEPLQCVEIQRGSVGRWAEDGRGGVFSDDCGCGSR